MIELDAVFNVHTALLIIILLIESEHWVTFDRINAFVNVTEISKLREVLVMAFN
jgi:hypothetical protein